MKFLNPSIVVVLCLLIGCGSEKAQVQQYLGDSLKLYGSVATGYNAIHSAIENREKASGNFENSIEGRSKTALEVDLKSWESELEALEKTRQEVQALEVPKPANDLQQQFLALLGAQEQLLKAKAEQCRQALEGKPVDEEAVENAMANVSLGTKVTLDSCKALGQTYDFKVNTVSGG